MSSFQKTCQNHWLVPSGR